MYTEITTTSKRHFNKIFLNHTSAIYIDNDSDLSIFQNAHQEKTINPNSNVTILH